MSDTYGHAIVIYSELDALERTELEAHEAVIERGLQTFIEVGTALLAIRDKRLYRASHDTFLTYCKTRWNMERRHAYRLMDASEVALNVSNWTQKIPANESQVRPLVSLEPDEQRLIWEVVQQTAPQGKVTAAHVKSVVDVFKETLVTGAIDNGNGESVKVSELVKAIITEETYERMKRQETHISKGVPAALQMSNSNEWYTPPLYIEAVHEVLGAVDTDPASNDKANTLIHAAHYYTIENDGFPREWHGRVFLNPPYGKDGGESNQEKWTARLIEQYQNGITSEAILLVNAVTDRTWFQPLWNYPICFTDHRIRFYDEYGEVGQPTHGSVFVYFGLQNTRFADVFKRFGSVVINPIREEKHRAIPFPSTTRKK